MIRVVLVWYIQQYHNIISLRAHNTQYNIPRSSVTVRRTSMYERWGIGGVVVFCAKQVRADIIQSAQEFPAHRRACGACSRLTGSIRYTLRIPMDYVLLYTWHARNPNVSLSLCTFVSILLLVELIWSRLIVLLIIIIVRLMITHRCYFNTKTAILSYSSDPCTPVSGTND